MAAAQSYLGAACRAASTPPRLATRYGPSSSRAVAEEEHCHLWLSSPSSVLRPRPCSSLTCSSGRRNDGGPSSLSPPALDMWFMGHRSCRCCPTSSSFSSFNGGARGFSNLLVHQVKFTTEILYHGDCAFVLQVLDAALPGHPSKVVICWNLILEAALEMVG